jgi:hypothetical protein
MARACSSIPTSNPPPGSFISKGELAQVSKGGCDLTTKHNPHVVSQQSGEALTTASRNLTHSYIVCPYIPHHPLLACLWQ